MAAESAAIGISTGCWWSDGFCYWDERMVDTCAFRFEQCVVENWEYGCWMYRRLQEQGQCPFVLAPPSPPSEPPGPPATPRSPSPTPATPPAPAAPDACLLLSGLKNVRDDGEWCNTPSRRVSAGACEAFFASWTVRDKEFRARCSFNPATRQCRLSADVCSGIGCDELTAMRDTRSLSPPEWCYTDRRRADDPDECHSYYATWEDADGERRAAPCTHLRGRCTLATNALVGCQPAT